MLTGEEQGKWGKCKWFETADAWLAIRTGYTATHCNTLQHTATHCNTLQHTHCSTHTATHSNTLQFTAAHSNSLHQLQYTIMKKVWNCRCTTCRTGYVQRSATHCNTLLHTATHCNTSQHTATHCNTLHQTVTLYNTDGLKQRLASGFEGTCNTL